MGVHIVALFWKVLAACIPPAEMCGGWFCFVVALIFIGAVTAVIGEMAKLLGCVLDISEFTTAITFVALGTSLPDTFASKTAAVQDKYADASIGNVTGSNSVTSSWVLAYHGCCAASTGLLLAAHLTGKMCTGTH